MLAGALIWVLHCCDRSMGGAVGCAVWCKGEVWGRGPRCGCLWASGVDVERKLVGLGVASERKGEGASQRLFGDPIRAIEALPAAMARHPRTPRRAAWVLVCLLIADLGIGLACAARPAPREGEDAVGARASVSWGRRRPGVAPTAPCCPLITPPPLTLPLHALPRRQAAQAAAGGGRRGGARMRPAHRRAHARRRRQLPTTR
jgi:hypothetical protein